MGKGSELVDWALSWLRRIRETYFLNRQRLKHNPNSSEFQEHDATLRESIARMHQQVVDELADKKLREPCRKVLKSLQTHWPGLTVFVDDPKIPMDSNASERGTSVTNVGSNWPIEFPRSNRSTVRSARLPGSNISPPPRDTPYRVSQPSFPPRRQPQTSSANVYFERRAE